MKGQTRFGVPVKTPTNTTSRRAEIARYRSVASELFRRDRTVGGVTGWRLSPARWNAM